MGRMGRMGRMGVMTGTGSGIALIGWDHPFMATDNWDRMEGHSFSSSRSSMVPDYSRSCLRDEEGHPARSGTGGIDSARSGIALLGLSSQTRSKVNWRRRDVLAPWRCERVGELLAVSAGSVKSDTCTG
jgi:hypothetical protein